MALINCPECGHQMSDTAKKCPNCGYSKQHNYLSRDYLSLYIGIFISIVSVSLLILAMPVMSGFSSSAELVLTETEFWIGIILIVVSCILFFFGCKFFKKYTAHVKKILLAYIGVVIISTSIFMCCQGVKLNDNYENTENAYSFNVQSTSEVNNSEKNEFLGTYLYVQPKNNPGAEKLTIILNEDETAVAKAIIRGEEKTYYGSWSHYEPDGTTTLTFSDAYFTWGRRTTNLLDAWIDWGEAINVDGSVIRDGYLYTNHDMAKAKNPEQRVKLEKTK